MARSASIPHTLWGIAFILVVVAMVAQSALITTLPTFANQGDLLSLAITIDLAFGIPLLYYLLICRKLNAPSVTTLVVFLMCVGIASLVLPDEKQLYLDSVKSFLITTELFLLLYLLFKARAIIVNYKCLKTTCSDFTLNLRNSMNRVMGENMATSILASEISMLRYGIFWWKLRKEVRFDERSFSTHAKSGYLTIWSVFVFVLLIETPLVHLLLWRSNTALAIVATVLSVYGLIFFIADLASLIKRPVTVSSDKLYLRTGIRWNSVIERKLIRSVEVIRGFDKLKEPETLDCSIMRDPNIRISLHEPVIVHGLYGIRKNSSCIVINIDDKAGFRSILDPVSVSRSFL